MLNFSPLLTKTKGPWPLKFPAADPKLGATLPQASWDGVLWCFETRERSVQALYLNWVAAVGFLFV